MDWLDAFVVDRLDAAPDPGGHSGIRSERSIFERFFPEPRWTARDEVLGIPGVRAAHPIPEGMREG